MIEAAVPTQSATPDRMPATEFDAEVLCNDPVNGEYNLMAVSVPERATGRRPFSAVGNIAPVGLVGARRADDDAFGPRSSVA